jgi:hypothetical protein
MMLTVSVTCITCATRMSALPGALGGEAGSTNTRRTARAPDLALFLCDVDAVERRGGLRADIRGAAHWAERKG